MCVRQNNFDCILLRNCDPDGMIFGNQRFNFGKLTTDAHICQHVDITLPLYLYYIKMCGNQIMTLQKHKNKLSVQLA